MNNTYTHLHLHTQYSTLDSAILIPDLINHLKENNMTACAISDHGWMAGVVDFYKQCKQAGIKPLLGCEMYITDDEDSKENQDKTRDNAHLLVIAKNNKGYSTLSQLISNAALNNFYYKPRVWREHLRELAGDVVVSSACLGGVLSKRLDWELDKYGRAVACSDPDGRAEQELKFYLDVFGDDFYLEVQVYDDDRQYQQVYNQWLINLGDKYKLPFIITADAHYIKQEDIKLHELLMALQLKQTIQEYRDNPNMTYGPHFYVASPTEMKQRAQSIHCEQAYWNTIEIAKKCDVEIELGTYEEPYFDITQEADYQEFLEWKKNK